MGKETGFHVTRKKESQSFLLPSRWRWALALLAAVLPWALGTTLLWSQSSEPRLNGSAGISMIWSDLFSQGQAIYETQRSDLAALRTELLSLRTGYDELMSLSERLSQSNENLRVFNEQIGQRMQERDMDLYRAYGRIDGLEKTVLRQRFWLAVSGGTVAFLTMVLILLLKGRR